MSPLLILDARAQARALLFRTAEYENLGEAITPLLVYAHVTGLAEEIGAEAVMNTIKRPFGEDWAEAVE